MGLRADKLAVWYLPKNPLVEYLLTSLQMGKGKEKEILEIIKNWLNKLRRGNFAPPLVYLLRKFFSMGTHGGVRVMEEEWDYLIILDACRYDASKKLNDLPGKLEKKISRGSSTEEWLKENFTDYYEETIYVSANPFVSKRKVQSFNGSAHFFKVEQVWEYGWDEELGTTPPEEVTKAALRIDKKYPKKRKIIHYLQPHHPFIGKTKLISKGETLPLWKHPKVKQAWMDNLKLVLQEVEKLVGKLEGRIVITADHGDCFGKFISGHPWGVYVKELVEVPWFIFEPGRIEEEK